MSEVSTPMGTSAGSTALVRVSAQRRSRPPPRKESTIRRRLSGPAKWRSRCGATRPTKPIIPDTATHRAVISEQVSRSVQRSRAVFTPNEAAARSPAAIMLRSRLKNRQTAEPAKAAGARRRMSCREALDREPMSQKMMMLTCSSARNLRKPMAAERMAATITPERIRLDEESRWSPAAKVSTATRAAILPAKAKSGTEKLCGRVKPITCRTMANEAPKAAPDETPRV